MRQVILIVVLWSHMFTEAVSFIDMKPMLDAMKPILGDMESPEAKKLLEEYPEAKKLLEEYYPTTTTTTTTTTTRVLVKKVEYSLSLLYACDVSVGNMCGHGKVRGEGWAKADFQASFFADAKAQAEAILNQAASIGLFRGQRFSANADATMGAAVHGSVNSAMSASAEVEVSGHGELMLRPPVWVYQTVVTVQLANGNRLTSKGSVITTSKKVPPEDMQVEVTQCIDFGTSYKGATTEELTAPTQDECHYACMKASACNYWKWQEVTKQCNLMSSTSGTDTSVASKNFRAGTKFCSWHCTKSGQDPHRDGYEVPCCKGLVKKAKTDWKGKTKNVCAPMIEEL